MAKLFMERKASDNEYLHKDFHGALNVAIEYLHQRYGGEAVRRYLRQFAGTYYSRLTYALKTRGLIAMKEHYENIYAIEGGEVDFEYTPDELIIKIESCPAVTHIKSLGMKPASLFHETIRTVNETICQGTPFAFELVEYDEDTGKSIEKFYRRCE